MPRQQREGYRRQTRHARREAVGIVQEVEGVAERHYPNDAQKPAHRLGQEGFRPNAARAEQDRAEDLDKELRLRGQVEPVIRQPQEEENQPAAEQSRRRPSDLPRVGEKVTGARVERSAQEMSSHGPIIHPPKTTP